MRRLILVPTQADPAATARRLRRGAAMQAPVWVFLGRSYTEQRRWAAQLVGIAEPLPIAARVQQTAADLRLPYLHLIADLGRTLQSDAWWASRISERNTLISHLFLYCCYLHIARALWQEQSGDVIVVAESWALLDAIAASADCGQISTIRLGGYRRWAQWPRFLAHAAYHIVHLALTFILSRCCGKDSALPASEIFLLHTYVEDACFGAGQHFKERYFPGLATWLEAQGHAVVMLPVLFNARRRYGAAWTWLRRSDALFINAHRHCRLPDYVHALAVSWRSARLRLASVELAGMDVTGLFVEERRRTAFALTTFLLYLRLPLRLQQRGIRVRQLVVEHENMIAEKLLTIGFRRHMPETAIVAYQHSGLYPLLLCSQVIAEEAAIAPLPHRVVCNGPFFLNILKAIGMPEHLLVAGPALRHGHLTQPRSGSDSGPTQCDGVSSAWDILLVLPMMKDDAAELLLKVIDAVDRTAHRRVALKLHPMLSERMLLREAGLSKLPENFVVAAGELGQMIRRAALVICMSSTSILEVAASGARMIVVGKESALDFNPLGFVAGAAPPVFSASQLASQVAACRTDGSPAAASPWPPAMPQCASSLFNPPDERLMPCFIH